MRGRILIACLSLVLWAQTAVGADAAEDAAPDGEGGTVLFDIPKMAATDALMRFAQQTSTPLLVSYELVTSVEANALAGEFTLAEGLRRLLAGTGIVGTIEGGVIGVHPEPAPAEPPSIEGEGAMAKVDEGSVTKTRDGRTDGARGSVLGRIGAALAAIVLSNGAIVAEDDSSSREDAGPIEEILVTAERRSQSAQDVPISMTVFGGDDLWDYGLEGSKQLGDVAPNLNFVSAYGEQGSQVITIRGITSANYSFMDGQTAAVYADEAILDSYWFNSFAMFDLERVEVLRGPQGTLFGRNSTAGALQFISAGPGDELDGYARVTLGKFNRRRAEVAIGGPLSDGFGVRVAGVMEEDDGFQENIHTGEEGPWVDTRAIRAVFDLDPSDEVSVRFKAQLGRDDSSPAQLVNRAPDPHYYGAFAPGAGIDLSLLHNPGPGSDHRKINLSFTNDEHQAEIDTYVYTLSIDWDLGSVALTSVTGYTDLEFADVSDWDGTAIAMWHGYESGDHRTFTQEFRLTSTDESPFEWIAGAYFLDQSADWGAAFEYTDFYRMFDPISFPPGDFGWGERYLAEQELSSWAVFAHTTYAWTDRLSTTHAIRYTSDEVEAQREYAAFTFFPKTTALSGGDLSLHDDFGGGELTDRDLSSSEVTWRLAAEYVLRDGVLVYGSVSQGYRGAVFAMFGPYKELDPELVLAYEAGIKSSLFDGRLRLNASIYYFDYTDFQFFDYLPAEGGQVLGALEYTFQGSNIPEMVFQGIEIEAVARPTENLEVRLSYGYSDNEIKEYIRGAQDDNTGNRLAHSDEGDFSGSIRYEFALGASAVLVPQLEAFYHGPRPVDSTGRSGDFGGDFWSYSARLRYENRASGFSVSAFVENISDDINYVRAVFPGPEAFGTDAMYITHPRSVGVTIGYVF